AGVWVSADGKPTKAPTSEDVAVPVGVAQALLPLAPLPLPQGVRRPAACAPSGASAKECVALDAHNAVLSSKLTELEGKMKALQGALGGTAAAKSSSPQGAVAPAVAASVPAAASASASSASASLTATVGPEAHAAKAAAGAAASAASMVAPPVATKQVRVLPKLKYKKEKTPEPQTAQTAQTAQTEYTLVAAAGVGLLALLGGGWLWWRRRKSGRGPLKIWQGFRRKRDAESGPEDFVEVNTTG
ncbi:LPXTG cell wall anchor domain-containing protein, partial [Duganella sp. FT50W]